MSRATLLEMHTRLDRLAPRKPHGTRVRYLGGCRCLPCRAANSRYSAERDRLNREGQGNPIVPADRARAHILQLSRQGVGYKAVASTAGVNKGIVLGIRTGTRTNLRKQSEARILAVDAQCLSDAAVVPAAPTWSLIRELLDEGFTKQELARRLGYTSPQLQFKRDTITARNASRVERFYRQIMRGA
jgi:hypothetical protein